MSGVNDRRNKTAARLLKGVSHRAVPKISGFLVMRKPKYSNYHSLQTDNKLNFGAGGNRKVKVSLAKVNLPPIVEEE